MDQGDIETIRARRPADDSDAARRAFVEALYRDLLGRPGDAGGLAAHCAAMAGGVAPLGIVEAFLESPEYRVRARRQAEAARDAARSVPPLAKWHALGWDAPRRIAFVGDSTTAHMGLGPAAAWAEAQLTDTGALPHTDYRLFGASGNRLHDFLQNAPEGAGLRDVIAFAPQLIVFCYGINDVRFGTVSADGLAAMLAQATGAILRALPACEIVLRVPNSLLTWGHNIVVPDGDTPAAAAQRYSDILRDAYRATAAADPRLLLYDTRGRFFTDTSADAAPYMQDDLHPTAAFYDAFLDDLTRRVIGRGAAPERES